MCFLYNIIQYDTIIHLFRVGLGIEWLPIRGSQWLSLKGHLTILSTILRSILCDSSEGLTVIKYKENTKETSSGVTQQTVA